MSGTEVEVKIRSIIAEQLGVAEADVKPESSFADDLRADSLDMVELVMAIEDAFNVELPEDKVEGIKTVQDAISYINGLKQ